MPTDTIRPQYQLRTLGSPPELRVDGRPYRFTNGKHLALLAYLVMEPGSYSREQLAGFVWGAGAAGSIDTALSELRAAFGPGVLPPRVRKVTVDPGLVEVDALGLLAAPTDAESRARAIELYRGPFLEGIRVRGGSASFARWIERTRGKLDEAFRRLCEQECGAAADAGDWARVLAVADAGLRRSPGWSAGEQWREAAGQALRGGPTGDPGAGEAPVAGQDISVSVAHPPAASPVGNGPAAAPPLRRSRWVAPALAGVATILLASVGLRVFRADGESEPLVQMPAVQAGTLAPPGSPITRRDDWVRTDGRWIYYRYERYLPGACRHRTRAVGNFGPGGWTDGPTVACLDAAWLAVDMQRVTDRFPLAPETTYCLQLLYVANGTSFWGRHGAEEAPGLDSIRVVAPAGQYNIGFAVVLDPAGKPYIELTHRFPQERC